MNTKKQDQAETSMSRKLSKHVGNLSKVKIGSKINKNDNYVDVYMNFLVLGDIQKRDGKVN